MKHGEKTVLCIAAGLALCTATNAITPDPSASPYQGIVDRNVFGLKPPPPPPDPEANKPPPPNITLTGILAGSVFGGKKAIMKTPPTPAKPGEAAPTERSFILGIGQREGDIEVLDIDEKGGSVKVNNSGNVVTLTFEKNGQKPSAGAPPAVPGGVPAPGGMPFQPIKTAANTFSQPGAANPGFAMPARTPRTSSGYGGAQQPAYGGAQPASGYSPGAAAVPQSTAGGLSLSGLGTPATQPGQFKNWPPEDYSMSNEEQAALNLVQRKQNPNVPELPGVPGLNELENPGSTPTPAPRTPTPTRLPNGQIMPQ
jgi:hypothetical protein